MCLLHVMLDVTDLSLALNALGFAGHILTKTEEEREWVQQAGMPVWCISDVYYEL